MSKHTIPDIVKDKYGQITLSAREGSLLLSELDLPDGSTVHFLCRLTRPDKKTGKMDLIPLVELTEVDLNKKYPKDWSKEMLHKINQQLNN